MTLTNKKTAVGLLGSFAFASLVACNADQTPLSWTYGKPECCDGEAVGYGCQHGQNRGFSSR